MPIVQGAGAATEASDNIIGQVKITNGTVVAAVLDLSTRDALAVAIVDSNGDQVTSFGGGTQYTEDAAAAANPVGTALNLIRADTPAGITTGDGDNVALRGSDYGALYATLIDSSGAFVSVGGGTQYDEDTASANAQKLNMAGVTRADTAASQVDTDGDRTTLIVDSSGRLHVNVGNTVTVTATNLDVQSGGADLATSTQAGAIQAAVEIMDDWDESDRAKVNLIAGQAGILGGNGGVAANVPRVTIANDSTGVLATVSTVSSVTQVRPPDIDVTGHTNYAKKYYTSTGAATDGIIWSPASGKRWHVVSMFLITSAAATVTLEDDKAGGDEVVLKGEFAANAGYTINFGEKYPLASGEDAADLMVTTSAGNIYITVTGYEV